jgi:hypothetical protein
MASDLSNAQHAIQLPLGDILSNWKSYMNSCVGKYRTLINNVHTKQSPRTVLAQPITWLQNLALPVISRFLRLMVFFVSIFCRTTQNLVSFNHLCFWVYSFYFYVSSGASSHVLNRGLVPSRPSTEQVRQLFTSYFRSLLCFCFL